MNLRRATPEDAWRLAFIHVDAWRAAYRGIVSPEVLARLDVEQRAQRFRTFLSSEDGETYTIEQGTEMVGFTTVGRCRDEDCDPSTAEIWGLYLVPECWRQGIGSAAVRAIETMLGSRGVRSIVLWTFAANDRARGFYEAMGFRADGASKTLDVGGPQPTIRLAKRMGDLSTG